MRGSRYNRKIFRNFFLFSLLWILLVLYPNPFNLAISLFRLGNPPVKAELVSDLALELKELGACEIRAHVQVQLPYNYDWTTYNMPWYFPTLEETLYYGTGDCKARFLLFASLLENLEIPYSRRTSLTHVWADYEGKPENLLENDQEAFFTISETGKIRLSIPRTNIKRSWDSFYRAFWITMPSSKKIFLLAGLPLIMILLTLIPGTGKPTGNIEPPFSKKG